MRIRFVAVLILGALASVIQPTQDAQAKGGLSFTTLDPGATRIIEQEIPINIVFVGYEEGDGPLDIDEDAFLAELPESSRPTVRLPLYYGLTQVLGLEFTYAYNVVYADGDFENEFFGYLGEIAAEKDLTYYQFLYNEYNNEDVPTLEITENYWIDAPSVEQWLADNAESALGIDTSEYTVFLVNWYGRSDFLHHVFTKTDEPDPDTDYNFGEEVDSRKLLAWGGTTPDDEESGIGTVHRIWFYDLSAGPEAWTGNWNLVDADLDGDDYPDYRMPPVWEYGNTDEELYRPFDDLSGDLGKVVRFVAINLLFTPSPIYDPALSPPKLPSSIQVNLNLYQADPDSDGNDWIQPDEIAAELGELIPLLDVTTMSQDLKYAGRAAQIYDSAMTYFTPDWDSSYGERFGGVPLADLYLYHTDHLLKFLDGGADYEVPTFCYNLTDDQTMPFLGWADDNWTDGTVSYVYCLDAPWARDYGYGFTATVIHEVGHHLGMSHPHDGYDYEYGMQYGPSGETFFAWSGDECNSIMSYIDLNWDFSQLDRDNMARYLTATYLNQANAILEKVCASPRASKAASTLEDADDAAGQALVDFAASDWASAAEQAKECYDLVLYAAASISIQIEPQAHPADYKSRGKSYHFIDAVDYVRLLP